MTMIEQSVVRTHNFSVMDIGLNPVHATNGEVAQRKSIGVKTEGQRLKSFLHH